MRRAFIGRKERLHESFIAALDRLDAEGREPDRWEEECLSYALGALACGMYLVAEVELDAFYRPPSERSPDAVAALAAKPRRFTKEMLRTGLEYAKARASETSSVKLEMPAVLAAASVDLQSSLGPSA
ncbi:MAG: hypothetical protein ACOY4R_17420 [Pseudomonadota bacterium]